MNKDERPIADRIREGLRRCLPVTKADMQLTCETCPYLKACEESGNDCTPVRLPLAMIDDIRRLTGCVEQ